MKLCKYLHIFTKKLSKIFAYYAYLLVKLCKYLHIFTKKLSKIFAYYAYLLVKLCKYLHIFTIEIKQNICILCFQFISEIVQIFKHIY